MGRFSRISGRIKLNKLDVIEKLIYIIVSSLGFTFKELKKLIEEYKEV